MRNHGRKNLQVNCPEAASKEAVDLQVGGQEAAGVECIKAQNRTGWELAGFAPRTGRVIGDL